MVKRKTRHLRRKRISKLQLEVLKTMFLTLFGVIVVSVAGTLVIRAFLSAVTETLVNPFYSMTYTDINIDDSFNSATVNWTKTNSDDKDLVITKHAKVDVPGSNQLKPVFVRMMVTTSVYDSDEEDAVNISSKYPDVKLDDSSFDTTLWKKKTVNGVDYYYYNRIVLPTDDDDGVTADIFGTAANNVTVKNGKDIPKGAQIRVNVIADTVQAVSVDTTDWKKYGFSKTEVQQAWGVAPTGDLPSATSTGSGLAVTWP